MKERRKERREEHERTNIKSAENEPGGSKRALCLNNREFYVLLLHTWRKRRYLHIKDGRQAIAVPEDKKMYAS